MNKYVYTTVSGNSVYVDFDEDKFGGEGGLGELLHCKDASYQLAKKMKAHETESNDGSWDSENFEVGEYTLVYLFDDDQSAMRYAESLSKEIGKDMNKYDELSEPRREYVDSIIRAGILVGVDVTKTTFSRTELRQVSVVHKKNRWVPKWITHDHSRRVGAGVYSIPEVVDRIKHYKEVAKDDMEDFASKAGKQGVIEKIWRSVDA